MFDIGPEKLLVVLVVALTVLGPQGIPKLAKGLGTARAQIRRLTADVHPDTIKALSNPRQALLDSVAEPRRAVTDAVAVPRLALADAIADFKLSGDSPGVDLTPSPLEGTGAPAADLAVRVDPTFN